MRPILYKTAVLLLIAAPVFATSVTSLGDIVASAQTNSIPGDPFDGKLLVFDSSGALRGDLLTVSNAVFAHPTFIPGTSDMYVARSAIGTGPGAYVLRLTASGTVVWSSQFFPSNPSGISIAASGAFYVSESLAPYILRFDSIGNYLGNFTINGAAEAIDLAADQCTLYYVANRELGQLNVCTGQLLQPLATLPSFSGDVRVLPD